MERQKEKKKLERAVRKDYFTEGLSYRSLAKRYGCSASTIGRLVMGNKNKKSKRKATRIEGWVSKPSVDDQTMPTEVNELQEALRMARLKIDLLEAMIDIADEQMGANIRKKAGAGQS